MKIALLKVTNRDDTPRRLIITTYVEWTLGVLREHTQHQVRTEFSREQEAVIDRLVASNSGAAGTEAGDRIAAWNRLVDSWQDRRR